MRVRHCRHFVIAFHIIFVMLERHCRFLDFSHFSYTISAIHSKRVLCFRQTFYWVFLFYTLVRHEVGRSWTLVSVLHIVVSFLHVSFYLYASDTLHAYVIFTLPALYNFSLLSVVWAKMKAKVDGQVFTIYSFWCIRKTLYIQCEYKSPKQIPFVDLLIQGLSLFAAYKYTPAKKMHVYKRNTYNMYMHI